MFGKVTKSWPLAVGIAMVLLVGGCSKPSGGPQAPGKPSGGDTAPPKAQAAQQSLTIKGSDTMVDLVSNWADGFRQKNAAAMVSVTGGGSGTGISALINGTTDICAASRDISAEERDLAAKQGFEPVEMIVARDGIAVVANPGNPVTELTIEQLAKIFTGADANWSQMGGPDQAITILSRESSSGTYAFFQEHVLKKRDYAESARLLPATSAIIQEVSSNTWAIGYVGLGYALEAEDKVKILGVKADANSPAVAPSEETVLSGAYPIARALQFYTRGTPAGLAKEFADFCLSEAGQKTVREADFVPVK